MFAQILGGEKTLEVQIVVEDPVKLSICCYIVLDKFSITNSVITLAKYVGTHGINNGFESLQARNRIYSYSHFQKQIKSRCVKKSLQLILQTNHVFALLVLDVKNYYYNNINNGKLESLV